MNLNDGGREKQPNLKDIPDELVEEFVATHPEGASAEAIAQTVGLSRERVSQILRKALAKCQRACKERDISPADVPCRQSVWDRLESS